MCLMLPVSKGAAASHSGLKFANIHPPYWTSQRLSKSFISPYFLFSLEEKPSQMYKLEEFCHRFQCFCREFYVSFAWGEAGSPADILNELFLAIYVNATMKEINIFFFWVLHLMLSFVYLPWKGKSELYLMTLIFLKFPFFSFNFFLGI